MGADRQEDERVGGAPEEAAGDLAPGTDGEAAGASGSSSAPAAARTRPAPDTDPRPGLVPAPDGGPPVPAAPGWLRPQPPDEPGPYGPKPYLPGPYAWVPPAGPRNGAGVAALVLGIVGAVLAFTMLLSPVAVILGGLALGFGVVAVRRARRGEAGNRKHGLWGVWLGACAAVVGVAMSVLLVIVAMDFFAPVSPETDSSVRAGETVTFDDGLDVTVDAEVVERGTLEVRVRVENGTGAPASLADNEVNAYPVGSDAAYLEQESGHGLPMTLGEDDVATGTYRFAVDDGLSEVEFEVAPGARYEYAYWWQEIDARTTVRPA